MYCMMYVVGFDVVCGYVCWVELDVYGIVVFFVDYYLGDVG